MPQVLMSRRYVLWLPRRLKNTKTLRCRFKKKFRHDRARDVRIVRFA
jgi:hypothetical protein